MEEALGPDLAADAVSGAGAVATTNIIKGLALASLAAIILLVVAFLVFPPFGVNEAGQGDPNEEFNYPNDAIRANFELPAPHVVWPADYHPPPGIIVWDVSISSTLFTGWIIMAIIIVLGFLMSLGVRMVPTKRQNALEYVYEGLANFAPSLGGPNARRYVPIFVAFFLFILLSNWSGLLPFVGRTQQLRAPTSDVNVTIGLALVAFALFHIEGVRNLGFRGYFSKFFNFSGFHDGIAAGIIGLFVGILEFFLEFIKPVTLSMRLFGNIYAGEVALGVISALTFSVLTLMFTLIAIEGHSEEEHAGAEEAVAGHLPEGNIAPKAAGA
jgi:F-type H+-transporting ATPase subunit a